MAQTVVVKSIRRCVKHTRPTAVGQAALLMVLAWREGEFTNVQRGYRPDPLIESRALRKPLQGVLYCFLTHNIQTTKAGVGPVRKALLVRLPLQSISGELPPPHDKSTPAQSWTCLDVMRWKLIHHRDAQQQF